MRKKYSLRQTWKHCLAMWEYVAENWDGDPLTIGYLKGKWTREHGFGYIAANCFFCHYVRSHLKKFIYNVPQYSCTCCPGKEVAPRFNCYKSGWNTDPQKFYRTLKRMYAKWNKLHPLTRRGK